MSEYTRYSLNQGVQVRREHFGLLFYNYRGPRLYFVPSQDLMDEDFFNGARSIDDHVEWIHRYHPWARSQIKNWVTQVIHQLEAKGLIHGESLC